MITDIQRLGKYELRQRLAHTIMAEVWKSYDSQLKRSVAIKFLRANVQSDPDFATRFMHEAEVIASLHHPNIVETHDFGLLPPQTPGTALAYLIMDCVEGQTLAGYIRSASRLGKVPPGADILHLVTSISLAIDYAHVSGIIHGNLKPANIFLPWSNPLSNRMGEPLVTDFGLVTLRGTFASSLTRRSLETALYMSPEQAQGLAGTQRSAIYSLGIMLYEMCTGVLPFQGTRPIALMMQHLSTIPTSPSYINPSLSPALSNVILRCLAKDPAMRFPDAPTMTAAPATALNLPVPEQWDHLPDQTGMGTKSSSVNTPGIPSSPLPAPSSSLFPNRWPGISASPAQANLHASFPTRVRQRHNSSPVRSSSAMRKGHQISFLSYAFLTLLLAALVICRGCNAPHPYVLHKEGKRVDEGMPTTASIQASFAAPRRFDTGHSQFY